MDRERSRWLALLLLACGCQGRGVLGELAPPRQLLLVVEEPRHGAYVGEGPVTVRGWVSEPGAVVWIEGHEVNLAADHSFRATVPVDTPSRTIDVEAARPGTHLRERRTVIAGDDPLSGWPGAITARLTQVGLDHLADGLAAQIDALDPAGLLEAALPDLAIGGLSLSVIGARTYPAQVVLEPGDGELSLSASLRSLELELSLGAAGGTVPIVLGLEELSLSASATLGLSSDGSLIASVSDTEVALGTPILQWGTLELLLLESLGATVTELVGGAMERILDLGALLLPALPLGAPLQLELDLFGAPLQLELGDVGIDPQGVGARLDVEIGIDPEGTARIPTAAEAGRQADLAVVLHEGMLQNMLAGDLLEQLELELELEGLLAELLALPLSTLPGGTALPADRQRICLSVSPGELRVARLEPSLDPLARLVLPELALWVGVGSGDEPCSTWLEASVALEAGLVVHGGTELGLELAVTDGALLSYAAPGIYPEDEVIGGLDVLIDASISLLDSPLTLDVSELFGTDPILGLVTTPRLLGAEPIRGDDGLPIDGLVLLPISLWDRAP
ncbi:MAG TPA: hypothetical protein ENK18_01340 [Deltaproteobacteria bacterium]|nr:hypothetical protein [Deltaproteobacteria bacterium]